MILSYNALQNKEDSSEGSVKEENFQEIKAIIKDKKKPEEQNQNTSFQNNSNWEENNPNFNNSGHISSIEKKNSSISSSLQGLSRGEDCIQKDVLKVIDDDSLKRGRIGQNDSDFFERKSSNGDEKIIDVSNELRPKPQNYILKSILMTPKEPGNEAGNNNIDELRQCFGSNNNTNNGLRQSFGTKYESGYQKNSTNFIMKSKEAEEKANENQVTYSHFHTQSQTQSTLSKEITPLNFIQQDKYCPVPFQNDVMKLSQQVDYLSLGMKKQMPSMFDYKNMNKTNGISYKNSTPKNSNNNNVFPLEDQTVQIMKQSKIRYEAPSESDLINNCARYCREQVGCRLLQKKLEEYPSNSTDVFYPKIKSQIIELSCDPFGNYFIQKIIAFLSPDKLEEFIQRQLPNTFRMMSFSPHGTRVIQKIFERVRSTPKLLNYYTTLLKPNMKDFIIDVNASHIIIQYVSLIPSPLNDFLIDYFVDNIYELAVQKHSCCALQKCIEYVNDKQKKILYQAVAHNSFKLFSDQYGNYVVQFVICACDYDVNHLIMVNFLKDFENFCIQKFSSNVIEKCLSYCSDETKQMIVKYLCNPQLVQHLLYDMYGNYVLQKGINIAKEPQRTMLLEYVGPHMEKLALLSFGPKLHNRLLTSFPELVRYMKNDKTLGMIQKKGKTMNNINNNNVGPNMSPSMVYQPPITSFQNYGNVYYQTNPMFNQYQNKYPSMQAMQPMQHMPPMQAIQPVQPMNTYMNPQFYQQGIPNSNQSLYMPMNYPMNTMTSNYQNTNYPSNAYMKDNININPFYKNN